jgi:cytochrome P450
MTSNSGSGSLDEIDLTSNDLFHLDNHAAIFDRLREEDPVHFQKPGANAGGFWNLTRYEDIMAVDTNHAMFSAAGSMFIDDLPDDFFVSMFLAMDPPRHTVYRSSLRPAFTSQHIALLEDEIRRRTRDTLDALPFDEPLDWVERVSMDLTAHVLATLFDFPSERRFKLIEWSDLAVLKTSRHDGEIIDWEARKQSFMHCLQEFNLIKAKRMGHEGIDLVTLLATSHGDKPLKPSEFLGNLLMLMFAGSDTTRNSISGSVVAFERFPEQLRLLKENESLLPGAIQEVFRWQTPVAYMRRTATRDCEIGGKRIKAKDRVVMWYVSGNRDSEMFDRPHEIDIARPNISKHMAFGYGVHRCLGLRLAEMQMRVLWQEIIDRYDRIELLEEPTHVRSTFIKGYSRLMVKLHRRRATSCGRTATGTAH